MSSILKVDQLQDSGGNNLVTSNGSGVITSSAFGKVLQVVTATDTTQRSTTSTSFVTGSNTLSVSITPSSTANKVYVIATTSLYSTSGSTAYATIYRDSTNLGSSSGMAQSSSGIWSGCPISILDSPSSTSALTYQVYFRVNSGTGYLNGDAGKASITAFEIGA